MSFEEYTITPGELASLTEPTPDLQRNYRQRGMIDGYGQVQENGRYKFNVIDLVGFWICDRLSLSGQGMDRRDGFDIGKRIAAGVITSVLKNNQGAAHRPSYYFYLTDGFSNEGKSKGSTIGVLSELDAVTNLDFDRIEIINVYRLSRTMPEKIRDVVLATGLEIARKHNDDQDS